MKKRYLVQIWDILARDISHIVIYAENASDAWKQGDEYAKKYRRFVTEVKQV